MNNKTILIPLSGGLDSTYTVYKALKAGYKVRTTYVEIMNNERKTENELSAINKINEYFTDNYYQLYDTSYENNRVDINNFTHSLELPQIPMFLFNLAYVIDESIDEIHLGGVLNDDMISFENEIKKAFNGLKTLFTFDKNIKLLIPYKKVRKFQIISELPDELLKLVTTCENPLSDGEACGDCGPCRRIFADELTEHPQYNQIIKNISKNLTEVSSVIENKETVEAIDEPEPSTNIGISTELLTKEKEEEL